LLPPGTEIVLTVAVDDRGTPTVVKQHDSPLLTRFILARLEEEVTRARWQPGRDTRGRPCAGTAIVTFKPGRKPR
jgi:hypothetical protein